MLLCFIRNVCFLFIDFILGIRANPSTDPPGGPCGIRRLGYPPPPGSETTLPGTQEQAPPGPPGTTPRHPPRHPPKAPPGTPPKAPPGPPHLGLGPRLPASLPPYPSLRIPQGPPIDSDPGASPKSRKPSNQRPYTWKSHKYLIINS